MPVDIETVVGMLVIWGAKEVWSWFAKKKEAKPIVNAAKTAKRAIDKGNSKEAKEAIEDVQSMVEKAKSEAKRIKDLRRKYGRE